MSPCIESAGHVTMRTSFWIWKIKSARLRISCEGFHSLTLSALKTERKIIQVSSVQSVQSVKAMVTNGPFKAERCSYSKGGNFQVCFGATHAKLLRETPTSVNGY